MPTRFVLVTLCFWSLLACHGSAPYVWVNKRPPGAAPNIRTVVGPGDMLEVQVLGEETTRGRVLPDGTLTLPLLGPMPVVGKTSEELARFLEVQLKRLMQEPHVTVVIVESLISLAVIGEVKQAGMVELVTPATVLQALAKAGGLTEYADSDGIYVLRTHDGATERIRFDYDALTGGERAATTFHLKTGDVLVVE